MWKDLDRLQPQKKMLNSKTAYFSISYKKVLLSFPVFYCFSKTFYQQSCSYLQFAEGNIFIFTA
jgi:hypothetical protein